MISLNKLPFQEISLIFSECLEALVSTILAPYARVEISLSNYVCLSILQGVWGIRPFVHALKESHMSYMPRVRCEACHAVCLWKKYLFCYVDEKLNMLIDAASTVH